jgi:nucleotide-binding universal stress UspA family protein
MPDHPSLFTTILVPIDDSESSIAAGRLAVRLAGEVHALLFFVYIVDPSVVRNISDTSGKEYRLVETEMMSDADSRLNHLSRLARDIHLDTGRTIRNGEPCGEIADLAEKQKADLIVVGRLKDNGREQAAVSAVTGQVLEQAPCPVLVVQ